MKFKHFSLLIALTVPASMAIADIGVYVKGGTLGLGGGVGIDVTDTLRLRAGYTAYKTTKDVSQTDIDYHGDIKLGGGEAMVDWHPFSGTFRVTGGLNFNKNKITVDGKPTNGSYTINDNTYTAAEIGSLNGNVNFKSTVPYLGIGWGDVVDKAGHFSFIADIGVMFQGSPDAKLHATCGATVSTPECAQIQSDLAVEEKDLNDQVSGFKYWPVLSIGMAYRF